MEEKCNYFTDKGTKNPNWAFNCIIRFLQFQKERVERLQQNTKTEQRLEKKLIEKEKEFESLYQKTVTNEDVIASLSDQLYNIMRELDKLKEQIKT